LQVQVLSPLLGLPDTTDARARADGLRAPGTSRQIRTIELTPERALTVRNRAEVIGRERPMPFPGLTHAEFTKEADRRTAKPSS
jgi:hypothetical protein